ncbi:tripartite tricarboxylate transporter TctB family protein [Agrobacterium sp. AGB01]|uniref:tripartite tricarboxylate transporter TctB family protein n=1 Tax=Agrobacterium sp. AGB01 TaxID=2769302 RepID=UPI001780CE4C|nr:tripartite tricarboxylate transporter TctB family protein [Agrobacterium sp. AGB01]MBD9388490.1 tripartite tricarboxylate transporter TctB family protein [Agrobacterium sp. AGB01]
MKEKFYKTPDGQAGILFAVFGLFVAWQSLQYPLGRASQMGPGFFPLGLGSLLAIVGAAVIINSIRTSQEVAEPFEWRSAFFITVAIIASGLLLLTAGVFVSIAVLVLVASLAARQGNLWSTLLSAVVLTLMAWLIFIVGLDLRIPLFWN